MSENKTAEEILYDNIKTLNGGQCLTFDNCLLSMQEYANQQTQELKNQVEALQIVKDELLKQVEELKWQVVTSDNEYLNLIREYTQLKEAADEMAKQMYDHYRGEENAEEFLIALNNYKQLTPKT